MSGMDTPPPQDPKDLRIAQLEAALAASQAALAKALERIAELERRLGMDSTNSSKPPSSDSLKTRAQRRTKKSSGKSQGAQKGHDGHHRQLLDASKVHHFLDHLPPRCRGCGNPLSLDEVCAQPVREQTFDLPPITPIVTEHRRLRCRCKACGLVTLAPSPLAPGQTRFGPNLLGLLAYLSVAMHATRRATRELVTQYLGIPASLGSIQNALDSVLPAIAPLAHQARAACQRAGSVGCDETGWSHQGKRAWIWCVQSEQAAFFKLQDKRDAAACRAMVEPLGQRVVVSDRFGAYNWIEASQHQVCHAHLKRDFAGMAKLKGKRGELGAALEKLCGQICVGHSEVMGGERTLKDYQEWVKNEVRPAWRELIKQSEGWGRQVPAVVSWCAKHEERVFRFAEGEEAIAPHNNGTERAVRSAVIKRKISFGTQSEAGKQVLEALWSVSQTCKKQGVQLSKTLSDAIAAFHAGLPVPHLV